MGDSSGLNEKERVEAGCGVVGLTEKKEGYGRERNRGVSGFSRLFRVSRQREDELRGRRKEVTCLARGLGFYFQINFAFFS